MAKVAKDAASIGSRPTAASLRAQFRVIVQDEGHVLAAAPAAVKGDFRTLFSVTDHFYAALAKVNYDYTKLSPAVERGLAASSAKLTGPSHAIQKYMVRVCGKAG